MINYEYALLPSTVLQNGSLLIVEENFEAFEVHDDNYCLDEGPDGLYAIVCIHSENNVKKRMLRGEAVINAACLWMSVPCLLLTAFFYLKIKDLRDLHGKTLGIVDETLIKQKLKTFHKFNNLLQHVIAPVWH